MSLVANFPQTPPFSRRWLSVESSSALLDGNLLTGAMIFLGVDGSIPDGPSPLRSGAFVICAPRSNQ